jgi:hypothetical protein
VVFCFAHVHRHRLSVGFAFLITTLVGELFFVVAVEGGVVVVVVVVVVLVCLAELESILSSFPSFPPLVHEGVNAFAV